MRKLLTVGLFLLGAFAPGLAAESARADEPPGEAAPQRLTQVEALAAWTKNGGDLDAMLSSSDGSAVKKAEAAAIIAALDALREHPERVDKEATTSPLFALTALFQNVESRAAYGTLSKDGLPRLRQWVQDGLDGKEVDQSDVLFVIKILAMYQQREDVDLIAKAARKPIGPDDGLWEPIFSQFDDEHPQTEVMIDALRDPLPTGFTAVAFLDLANGAARDGTIKSHPFDSEAGKRMLEAWLRDADEDKFSYAQSAAAALPFIGQASREALLKIADDHPDRAVRMEAAWARGKSGDESGLDRLAKFCLDVNASGQAQRYLEELAHADRIPAEAKQSDFQARAEMSEWLAHPQEFGHPPDSIEVYDSRELFWPPTNDKRRLTLLKYSYKGAEGEKPAEGVGMVGSVTFALLGEATGDLSPEDLYGLHCCWELRNNDDPRAPEKRSAKAGREILAKDNKGF